jgi:hypothetical protein
MKRKTKILEGKSRKRNSKDSEKSKKEGLQKERYE